VAGRTHRLGPPRGIARGERGARDDQVVLGERPASLEIAIAVEVALDPLREHARARPVVGILGKRGGARRVQLGCDRAGFALRRRHARPRERDRERRGRPRVQRLAGQDLEQDRAERVDVARGPDRIALDLLG
jgi:hypothetical protein